MNWNPLYPTNDNSISLENSIREAEWEDDLHQAKQKQNEESQ